MRESRKASLRRYGGVIRRTGTGEVPEPPTTGVGAIVGIAAAGDVEYGDVDIPGGDRPATVDLVDESLNVPDHQDAAGARRKFRSPCLCR